MKKVNNDKELPGKKLLDGEKAKEKQSKETNMNTSKKTIIVSVLLTLVTVGSLAGMFVLGMNYNQSVNDRVHSEVKALTSVQVPVSKQ